MLVDYTKYADGLVPVIVQHYKTQKVLTFGFMNAEALNKTLNEGRIIFFSRVKNRLCTKGEEDGNFLLLKTIAADFDNESLLIKAAPLDPIDLSGTYICNKERNGKADFLLELEDIIDQRRKFPPAGSYIAGLFSAGINKIAQKLGEEAIEMIIEAKDQNDELFLNESADLLFHYLILLNSKGHRIENVIGVLKKRQKKAN